MHFTYLFMYFIQFYLCILFDFLFILFDFLFILFDLIYLCVYSLFFTPKLSCSLHYVIFKHFSTTLDFFVVFFSNAKQAKQKKQ